MLSDLLVNSFIEHREEIEKWSKIELQVDSTLDTDFDSCTDLLKDNLTKLTELNLLSLAVSKEQSRAVHHRKFMSLAQTMQALKTSDSGLACTRLIPLQVHGLIEFHSNMIGLTTNGFSKW